MPQREPSQEWVQYLPKGNAEEYRKGELIYNAGQPSGRIYAVTDDRVLISRTVNREKQIVAAILEPPDIFGEFALVNPLNHSEQALAIETSHVVSWPATELVDRVMKQGRLGMALLGMLARREAELTSRMESLAVDKIHLRVARTLIGLSGRIGIRQEDGSSRIAPLTHKLLSQYIGSTREIVTHHMTEFRKRGFLNYSRNGIVIHRETLMEWLEGSSHAQTLVDRKATDSVPKTVLREV